jgi:hypothetical protein
VLIVVKLCEKYWGIFWSSSWRSLVKCWGVGEALEEVAWEDLGSFGKIWGRLGSAGEILEEVAWEALEEVAWEALEEVAWEALEEVAWEVLEEVAWEVLEEVAWEALEEVAWEALEEVAWEALEEVAWEALEEVAWEGRFIIVIKVLGSAGEIFGGQSGSGFLFYILKPQSVFTIREG